MSIEELKKCPFCGEEILKVAIVCKHCKSDLETGNSINKNKEEDEILILFKSPFTFISLIVLLGMFLPWMNNQLLSLNAFDIKKIAEFSKLFGGETNDFILFIGYLLYLVPILIGIVIFINYQYIINNKPKDKNSLRFSSSLVGIIIIIAILSLGTEIGMSKILNSLGIGAIISLVASIILLFFGFGLKNEISDKQSFSKIKKKYIYKLLKSLSGIVSIIIALIGMYLGLENFIYFLFNDPTHVKHAVILFKYFIPIPIIATFLFFNYQYIAGKQPKYKKISRYCSFFTGIILISINIKSAIGFIIILISGEIYSYDILSIVIIVGMLISFIGGIFFLVLGVRREKKVL